MQRLAYRPMLLACMSIIRIIDRVGAAQCIGGSESTMLSMICNRRSKVGNVDAFHDRFFQFVVYLAQGRAGVRRSSLPVSRAPRPSESFSEHAVNTIRPRLPCTTRIRLAGAARLADGKPIFVNRLLLPAATDIDRSDYDSRDEQDALHDGRRWHHHGRHPTSRIAPRPLPWCACTTPIIVRMFPTCSRLGISTCLRSARLRPGR